MPKNLKLITLSLQIALLPHLCLLLFGVILLVYAITVEGFAIEDQLTGVAIGASFSIYSLAVMIFIPFVVKALKEGFRWAWIAAISMGFLSIPTIFVGFSIFIIAGSLDNEVQAFCVRKKQSL